MRIASNFALFLFCFTTPCDKKTNVSSISQQMGSRTKTNHDLVARAFPRLSPEILIDPLCCSHLLWLIIVMTLVLALQESIENRSITVAKTTNNATLLLANTSWRLWHCNNTSLTRRQIKLLARKEEVVNLWSRQRMRLTVLGFGSLPSIEASFMFERRLERVQKTGAGGREGAWF